MEVDFDCPVCFVLMEDPRILPCGHSLCFACVQQIKLKDRLVTCPMCREPVNQAYAFPKNYQLSKIVEGMKNQQQDRPDTSRLRLNAANLINEFTKKLQEELTKKEVALLASLATNLASLKSPKLEIRSNLELIEVEIRKSLEKAYCTIFAGPSSPTPEQAAKKTSSIQHTPVKTENTAKAAPIGAPPKSTSYNNLYVVDGNIFNESTTVLVYDWQRDVATPVVCNYKPRMFAAAIQAASRVYVLGGESGSALQDCFSFDPVTTQCINLPSLNMARTRADATNIDSTLYIVGGGNRQTIQTSLEMLDLRESKWHVISSDAKPRLSHQLIASNGEIYLVGGFNGRDYSNKVEVFDLRMRKWRRHSRMSYARSDFACCVTTDGNMMTFGGHNSGEAVELFDSKSGQWMREQSLPFQVRNGVAFMINNQIKLFGNLTHLSKSPNDGHPWQVEDCTTLTLEPGATLC